MVRWLWLGLLGLGWGIAPDRVVAQEPAPAAIPRTTSGNIIRPHELHFQLMQLVDQLRPYQPADSVHGTVTLQGSITMRDLGLRSLDLFQKVHPEVRLEGKAEGSEAALRVLAENPKILAGVSRPVQEEDERVLKSGKCREPIAITVGFEAMAVMVHRSNPLPNISLETLKAIYAAGAEGQPAAKHWGDVGVEGEWADSPIVSYERDENSGTQVFLSRILLNGVETAKTQTICPSNFAVCSAIGDDPHGIGIADINYVNEKVRLVPLLDQGRLLEPNESNVLTGAYPLMRPLLLVADRAELSTDGGARGAFVRWMLSREGQLAVMKSGFYPLDPGFVDHQWSEIFGPQLR